MANGFSKIEMKKVGKRKTPSDDKDIGSVVKTRYSYEPVIAFNFTAD